ncbi:MAG TPA: hypothetical protein ENH87_00470 [Pricia antarctica]|uniref:Uncharacterized protein n=1 Tax=Pricia antarctica TaxID=641691 RepID=A0A831VM45_9FLAO|nr:hypothetical protein [Pricia antarctica]
MQNEASEIIERSQNDFRGRLAVNRIDKINVREVALVRDIQLAVDELNDKIKEARELFKETGKIT